jgi:hypothetical protein
MPVTPQEDPPINPGKPSEPLPEDPPGTPQPEIPDTPVKEPGAPSTPEELPGYIPGEMPSPGTPGPAPPLPSAAMHACVARFPERRVNDPISRQNIAAIKTNVECSAATLRPNG